MKTKNTKKWWRSDRFLLVGLGFFAVGTSIVLGYNKEMVNRLVVGMPIVILIAILAGWIVYLFTQSEKKQAPQISKPLKVLGIIGILILGSLVYFAIQIPEYTRNPIQLTDIHPPDLQPEVINIPWWLPPSTRKTIQKNNDGVDELNRGFHDKAIAIFREEIKHDSLLPYLHNNLGCAIYRTIEGQLQLDNAIEEFEKAIKLNKKDPIPYENFIAIAKEFNYRDHYPKIRVRSSEAREYETRKEWRDWLYKQRNVN